MGQDLVKQDVESVRKISIHLPRVGQDITRPPQSWRYVEISIHLPRVGQDLQ